MPAARRRSSISPSSSTAAATANSGAVQDTVAAIVGPSRALDSNTSSVTAAGKNSPMARNIPSALIGAAASAGSINAGSASQNSNAADGTLTVTPARALMWRRPTLLAIIAQAKANAEAIASRSVNAGASDATSDPFPGAPAAS